MGDANQRERWTYVSSRGLEVILARGSVQCGFIIVILIPWDAPFLPLLRAMDRHMEWVGPEIRDDCMNISYDVEAKNGEGIENSCTASHGPSDQPFQGL